MMTANENLSDDRLADDASIEHLDSILANSRRRHLLYCLYLYANPMRLPDIADQITVWEQRDCSDTYEQERLWVYNSLYHDHLPVLRAADLVTYHQLDDKVELCSEVTAVESSVKSYFESELEELLAAEEQSIAHKR